MSNTKAEWEEIRKEWYACYAGDEMPSIMEKSADWWLEKVKLAFEAGKAEGRKGAIGDVIEHFEKIPSHQPLIQNSAKTFVLSELENLRDNIKK